ncbi:hypothetical protein NC797_07820 [Aquibacillus sp. 3ASR75-11]|uniref:Uncharacterized protein n=1 Tax=Terrihalobacillus insolitus TaxID=2950438 RepID=A0A9X3WW43_9BACI|nr:hypothetical protein [Terrihalobacillus insolitus]MDC3424414.1 hypothetical protein [Terrihalobacillus insolitus]
MFNLPMETAWAFLPWPILWLGLALYMYFKLKKEDHWEDTIVKKEKGED